MNARRASPPPLQVRLLGTPQLVRGDGAAIALERKGAALLALLALDGPQPRERAASLVWPEADRTRSRNSLRQRLHLLRKAAGQDVIQGDETLALHPAVQHDLADPAARLDADPFAARGPLLGALDYDDADLLASWVAQQRQRWDALRLRSLADIASRLEHAHHIERALAYAEQLVAGDPLQEHAHRRLMRLHYLRGDRAAALAAFDRLAVTLARELDTRPSKETLDLAALIGRSGDLPGPRPEPPPLALMRPPVLVGRATQWRQLEEAVAARRVALVRGEPGIGKSRLIGAFAESQARAPVFSARPDDERVPYALLARLVRGLAERFGAPRVPWAADALAHIAPELSRAPVEPVSPLRLRQALVQGLHDWAACGAALIAIDDLQFADAASLETVLAIVPDRALPVAWVLGSREAELPAAVSEWLDRHGEDAIEPIPLQALDLAATRALLESLQIERLDAGAWAGPLVRHTGGNPMFVLETLRALLAADADLRDRPPERLPTPQNVGRLIERRLEKLSPQALRLARVAAVAGTSFDAALAASVLDAHPVDIADAWRELESAQVIRGQAFAHDLIFEAARRSVPEPIARVLHASVAAFLEGQAAAAITVAHHWYAAREWHRAGPMFRTAAEAARLASRRKEESDALALAAEAFANADMPRQRFEALEQRFEATRYVEQFRVSRQIADELVMQASGPAERARALASKARVLADAYDYADALPVVREAIALASGVEPDTDLLDLARIEAHVLSALERHDEAVGAMERWAPHAARFPDGRATARFLVEYGERLYLAHRVSEGVATLERAVELAHANQDWSTLYDALNQFAGAVYVLGKLDLAIGALERARSLLGRLGADRPPTTIFEYVLARYLREAGRFAEAHAQIERTIADLRGAGNDVLLAMAINELAWQYLWMGQLARARSTLALHATPLPPNARGNMRSILAYLAIAEGKNAAAALREVMADIPNDGRMDYYLLRFTIALCSQVPAGEGIELARAGIAKAEMRQQPIHLWPLKVALVEAQTRAGRAAEAAPLALEVLERFASDPPLGRYPAEYWLHIHRCLDEAGRKAPAREALSRGVRWVREVGLRNLPAMWHDAFVARHPVNTPLLAAARREGIA